MRRIGFVIFLSLVLYPVSRLGATTSLGGKGLIHTQSARVLPKGYVTWFLGSKFFGKVAQFGVSETAFTLWNVQGFMSFNWGVNTHLELAVSPVFYQDTNRGGTGFTKESVNFPDDLFLGVKLGSFGSLESPFLFGCQLTARIPTAKKHNIIYEPYSAGRLEIGVAGMASYFSNTVFPDDGWSAHFNLEYLNHNDVGKNLISDSPQQATAVDNPKPVSMSSEMILGIGFLYPTGTFDFSGEIHGRYFLVRPPVTAYSAESVTVLTAGIYYHPYPWVTFEMGMDVRLFSEADKSVYAPLTPLSPPPNPDFPNYPSWRGVLGMKLAVLPTSLYASRERKQLEKSATDRRLLLEKMMKDQKGTEDTESELSRIRSERQRVEEELQRLRKLLEEEKKKKDGE